MNKAKLIGGLTAVVVGIVGAGLFSAVDNQPLGLGALAGFLYGLLGFNRVSAFIESKQK